MYVSTLSSGGQITIPVSVREALRLKAGDEVAFQEENGRYYVGNASLLAFVQAERDFSGAADEAGFSSEADLQQYMEVIRKEVRGY